MNNDKSGRKMIRLRERPAVKCALCLIVSCVICLTVVLLLYKEADQRALFGEFPLLLMLCAGLSLAITLFDALHAAVLTLVLVGEYAALSFFASQLTGDWELRVLDIVALQVSLRQTRMLFPAAVLTAAGAFLACLIIVKALSRREKKEPRIVQAVSYDDTRPVLPPAAAAELALSQEEIECLLGKNEHMAVKK